MNALPKISVIVPVLNSAHTIEKALLSVIQQNYPHIEIIILDAGSTDGTVDVIKRYEKYIHYWHSKPDGSSGLAINLGLELASGVLTSQLMADDWFEPNTFMAIGKAYLENPAVDVISCGGRFVKYDAQTQQYQTFLSYTKPQQLELTVYNMCFGIPAMSSRFITKAMVTKAGLLIPFDSNGKHIFSADREYLLRIAVLGCNNVIIDHLGHTYFAHEKSATFGNSLYNKTKVYGEHMVAAKSYLQKYSLTRQQAAILRYWYRHQSVRLFIYEICSRKWNNAWLVLKAGIKEAKLQWLIALFLAPCKIAISKGYSWIKGKIKNCYD